MKAKIYTNRVNNYQADFSKAKDYFFRHNVNIDFTFVPYDYKPLSYEVRQFPQGQRVILKPYMAQILAIDTSYDITGFLFNGQEFPPPNIPTGYTYVPIKQPFMDLLHDDRTPLANYLLIIHEIMHAIGYILQNKGINISAHINAIMDTYALNDQPENVNSNFGQCWTLLKPYLPLLEAPQAPTNGSVTIKRNISDSKETTGILTAFNNGATFSCKTLELADKNNQPNISCIPKGNYIVKWTFSPRFLKFTYEVQSVPMRSGIRIHSTNFYSQLLGCIALGNALIDINSDGELDTVNSRLTISAFENFMGRKTFNLTIQ